MKTSKKVLLALLIWAFLMGSVDAYFAAPGHVEPLVWFVGSAVFSLLLIFVWYSADARQQAYRRPAWLTVVMIFAAVIAVPIYLCKSRVRGARLKAVLSYLGFLLLWMAAYGVAYTLEGWLGW